MPKKIVGISTFSSQTREEIHVYNHDTFLSGEGSLEAGKQAYPPVDPQISGKKHRVFSRFPSKGNLFIFVYFPNSA